MITAIKNGHQINVYFNGNLKHMLSLPDWRDVTIQISGNSLTAIGFDSCNKHSSATPQAQGWEFDEQCNIRKGPFCVCF